MDPGDTPKPRSKPDLHQKKIMICVWSARESLVHWKMLEKNATVNKARYIVQLHLVNEAIRQKRSDRFGQTERLHDNAQRHVAQVVKAALQELEWEFLQHPPYFPDFASSDYHLFCSLSNYMKGVTFDNKEVLKNWLNSSFDTRPNHFLRNGINKLVERWEEVVKSKGENRLG